MLEAAYVLQITPFAKLQPDLQFVWNPANNPNADHALVFQLQLNVEPVPGAGNPPLAWTG